MSIWSSQLTLEPLREPAYNLAESNVLPDSWLDVATADAWYEHTGLRMCLELPGRHCAILTREQVTELRDCLSAWLAADTGSAS